MLIKILIGVVGGLVVIAAVAATRSSAYHVERKLDVAAPADVVFAVLNDLRQFSGVLVMFGSTLEKNDPNMQNTFEGPAAGVGQSWAWSGKKAGQGSLTIESSVPGQKVTMKLVFVKPMASTASVVLTLAPNPNGSSVTWSMAGEHIVISKVIGMFMNMDKMLANDIDKGLVELKTVAEARG
jgi:carbon monoxide dehydrogenase subunit G